MLYHGFVSYIYFKNGGCKGVVLKFNDDSVGVQALLSDNAVNVAMGVPWNCEEKVDSTRGTGLWQPGDEVIFYADNKEVKDEQN